MSSRRFWTTGVFSKSGKNFAYLMCQLVGITNLYLVYHPNLNLRILNLLHKTYCLFELFVWVSKLTKKSSHCCLFLSKMLFKINKIISIKKYQNDVHTVFPQIISRLPDNCMTALWLSDIYLTTDWQLTNLYCLTTTSRLPHKNLTTAQHLIWLTITKWW